MLKFISPNRPQFWNFNALFVQFCLVFVILYIVVGSGVLLSGRMWWSWCSPLAMARQFADPATWDGMWGDRGKRPLGWWFGMALLGFVFQQKKTVMSGQHTPAIQKQRPCQHLATGFWQGQNGFGGSRCLYILDWNSMTCWYPSHQCTCEFLRNQCPKCGWWAHSIDSWPSWDGVIRHDWRGLSVGAARGDECWTVGFSLT